MKEIFIGDVIKKRRLELGLTQEELCEGICEPITVSRLENGRQTPSRNRLNALLERLDLPSDRYYALFSENELEIDQLQREIALCNTRFSQLQGEEKKRIRERGFALHRKLEAVMEKDDRISRQLILVSQVLLGEEDGPLSPEERRSGLLEAIRLTVPSFDPEEIGKGLYTIEEVSAIHWLAMAHHEAGEHREAIRIWKQLDQYVRKHLSNVVQARPILTRIAWNLAQELNLVGQYKEAIEIAQEGQRVCLDYGHFLSLPGLLTVMAESWHSLGEDEKSIGLYYQSYYLRKAIGDTQGQESVRIQVRNDLGFDLAGESVPGSEAGFTEGGI